ncbi:Mss4-like protein [Gongronella butleri]|nr:Mss4-like protein [Gongronella butleri]
MCRQVSGAAFWTNITIPRKSFHVDKGEMQIYKSSDFAERGFCATCGSTLTFAYLGDEEEIDVGIGNFDDPHAPAIQPDCHMWVENGLLPYDLTLPQYLTNSKGPRAN